MPRGRTNDSLHGFPLTHTHSRILTIYTLVRILYFNAHTRIPFKRPRYEIPRSQCSSNWSHHPS